MPKLKLSILTPGVTDRHWVPASLHCNLCHTRYDFVLKLESLHQDLCCDSIGSTTGFQNHGEGPC